MRDAAILDDLELMDGWREHSGATWDEWHEWLERDTTRREELEAMRDQLLREREWLEAKLDRHRARRRAIVGWVLAMTLPTVMAQAIYVLLT